MDDTKRLARPVTVAGVTYYPGDPIPDDALAKIRNPKAWVPLGKAEQPQPSGPAGTSSGHRLAGTVTVGGKSYGPADFVPDEVARKIRNPKAWEGGELPDLSPAESPAPPAADPDTGPDTAADTGPDTVGDAAGGADTVGDGGVPDDKPRDDKPRGGTAKAAAKRG